jgi:hypothetical protein
MIYFCQKMITTNNDLNQPPSQFLYLTTTGQKTLRQHIIEIWFVEYNKDIIFCRNVKKL